MNSFFDENFVLPTALRQRLSRRRFLKSAAAASAITLTPNALANMVAADKTIEPWRTLNHVLEHLLPSSKSGPGAKDIRAIDYLYNVVNAQPTDPAESTFIKKGVGWLNGYTQGQLKLDFYQLSLEDKETSLRAISKSTAGENWINTLITYLYEALLTPPIYGGNPDGIGWQWLNHKAGFPLPTEGKRYYELPAYAAINVKNIDAKIKTQTQTQTQTQTIKSDKKAQ